MSRITIIAEIAKNARALKRCGDHCKNSLRLTTHASHRLPKNQQDAAAAAAETPQGSHGEKSRAAATGASFAEHHGGRRRGRFVLNIISSVFIISVNKRLMGSPPNFNFRYVVTLNALHYITASIWTRVAKVIGLAKQEESSKAPAHVPLSSVVLFTTVSNASIISLNTSLMLNLDYFISDC